MKKYSYSLTDDRLPLAGTVAFHATLHNKFYLFCRPFPFCVIVWEYNMIVLTTLFMIFKQMEFCLVVRNKNRNRYDHIPFNFWKETEI